jgi:hypothetical protein
MTDTIGPAQWRKKMLRLGQKRLCMLAENGHLKTTMSAPGGCLRALNALSLALSVDDA